VPRKYIIFITLVLIISGELSACKSGSKYEPSYSYDVEPIFQINCFDCHGENGANNLDLTSYSRLMSGNSANGPVVIPYNAENSLLFQKVYEKEPIVGNRMPWGRDPLPMEDINTIGDWIQKGARDN
jgi:mono/diheme cytochrome c family protein